MEGATFINDTTGSSEWKGLISTVYAELYSEIVSTGLRHFEKTHTITTDGTDKYALPADFMVHLGMDYQWDTQGHTRPLREQMAQERHRFAGASGNSEAVAFAIVGTGTATGSKPIELYPKPTTGKTYKLIYIPQPADLSTAADSTLVDVVTPAAEEFIICGVVFLAKDKEESDVTTIHAERERHRARVIDWARLRAFNQPRRQMVDEEFDEYDGGFFDGRWQYGGYGY